MKRRSTTLTALTIALVGAFLLGCQDQGPTQATLDDIPPDFTPGFAKGGKGGGPGGGDGGPVSVVSPTMGGIIATEGAGDPVADDEIPMFRGEGDNSNNLEIRAGVLDLELAPDPVAVQYAFSYAQGDSRCQKNGGDPNDPTEPSEEEMIDVLRGSLPPNGGSLNFPQALLIIGVSLRYRDVPSRKHVFRTWKQYQDGGWQWIVNLGTPGKEWQGDDVGSPLVTWTDPVVTGGRTHTTYTFVGGHGIVRLNPRFGPDVGLVCPFLAGDDLTFTVIEG